MSRKKLQILRVYKNTRNTHQKIKYIVCYAHLINGFIEEI